MEKEIIPLSVPNLCGNEAKYVNSCLEENFVSSVGSYVDQFEQEFAKYLGVECAVAVMNGTAALHVALLLSGVGSGDEVLVPNLTFVAPLNAVKYVGANPILVDCTLDNLGMCPVKLESFLQEQTFFDNDGQCINKKTKAHIKAVLPVHVFGHAANISEIERICKIYHLILIEDASESLGAKHKGKFTGTYGQFGCFSFNGNKIITSGGGGMIVTNDLELGKKAKHLTTTAKTDPLYFKHDRVGYNYRMVNVLAAIGLAQLENLEKFLETKKKNLQIYREKFHRIDWAEIYLPKNTKDSTHWFYSLYIKDLRRTSLEDFINFMLSEKVQVRPIWEPMENLPAFKQCQKSSTEISQKVSKTFVNVPCSTDLHPSQIDRVVNTIASISVNTMIRR